MSGQRSDWRERLHANPSRMEQELAIKLQKDQVHPRNVKSSCSSRRESALCGRNRRVCQLFFHSKSRHGFNSLIQKS